MIYRLVYAPIHIASQRLDQETCLVSAPVNRHYPLIVGKGNAQIERNSSTKANTWGYVHKRKSGI